MDTDRHVRQAALPRLAMWLSLTFAAALAFIAGLAVTVAAEGDRSANANTAGVPFYLVSAVLVAASLLPLIVRAPTGLVKFGVVWAVAIIAGMVVVTSM